MDSNAELISLDENVSVPLSESTNMLVDSATLRKCEWKCKSGFTRSGSICVKNSTITPISSDKNSIVSISGVFDTNIFVDVKCDANITDANILVKKNNQEVGLFSNNSCLLEGNKININLSESSIEFKNGDILEVTLKIPAPCEICNKTIYVPFKEKTESQIPDNNIFLVMLVLVVALFILVKKE